METLFQYLIVNTYAKYLKNHLSYFEVRPCIHYDTINCMSIIHSYTIKFVIDENHTLFTIIYYIQ